MVKRGRPIGEVKGGGQKERSKGRPNGEVKGRGQRGLQKEMSKGEAKRKGQREAKRRGQGGRPKGPTLVTRWFTMIKWKNARKTGPKNNDYVTSRSNNLRFTTDTH